MGITTIKEEIIIDTIEIAITIGKIIQRLFLPETVQHL